jgi:hypothetical protein
LKTGETPYRKEEGSKRYWRNWYIAIMLALVLQIGFYYFITVYFK